MLTKNIAYYAGSSARIIAASLEVTAIACMCTVPIYIYFFTLLYIALTNILTASQSFQNISALWSILPLKLPLTRIPQRTSGESKGNNNYFYSIAAL